LAEINHRAAGIREIKRDVCFPKRDTHIEIKDKLEALICAIADGVWAELPTFEPPDISPGRRRRLIGIVRQVFIAFLPLGILGFTKVANISLDSTISAYLWTSAIGWAILGILVILDPGFRDRVRLSGTQQSPGGASTAKGLIKIGKALQETATEDGPQPLAKATISFRRQSG
jgi:hypothetical protein